MINTTSGDLNLTLQSCVVYFRKLGKPETKCTFKINNNRFDLVDSCQYLVVIFNDHSNYHDIVNAYVVSWNRP